ncbi:cytochrome b/b6 domain-containing protein [Microbacterium sp. 1P10UB]|uniref:cytochrome b/b6 domain-containing protein n=1 Tax=unclassified Microbacterium TaxID=2609290 RepID=UPI0039A19258
MATFGTQVRRGLPRTRGGEPWPPAGEAPHAAADVAGVTETAPVPEAVPVPEVVPVPRAGSVADATPVAEATHVAMTDAAAPAVAPPPVRAIRRGLPRVPGGEPWPPAVASAAPDAPAAADMAVEAPTTAAPQNAGAAASPASSVAGTALTAVSDTDAAAESASSAPAAAPANATPSGGVALRRGLPRVAGGEPWPLAGTAPEAGVTRAAPSAATATATAPAATAPPACAPAAATAPAATAEPAAPATEAAPVADEARVAASVSPDLAPVSASAAGSVVVSGPRPPLPFTRTVWAGRAAQAAPVPRPAPERIRGLSKVQWAGAVIGGGIALLFAAAMLVFAARWFVSLPGVQSFLTTYPGETHLPEGAPVGFPAWLAWQHFFNTFFIVLIIRTGWQVRAEKRPAVFWTPRWSKKGRGKISLALWFHQSLDVLWFANGLIFIVLLFATGQWMRVVPTSWDVFPNALSAALQYVSLDWPTENGWVNYNSLQVLAYFATIFIAAPLAAVTGVRMSGFWPKKAERLNKAYPIEWARAVHFPVMLYFVGFIVVHVALVFATGALRNLNHMYGGQDAVNWTGFWIFVGSMALLIAGWIAARPMVLAPIARLSGKVSGR